MNYEQIRTQLDQAVNAVTGIPAIVGENVTAKATASVPFTRTTLLPARPNQLTMGVTGQDELTGLYQIDLYCPLGSGAYAATLAADLVVAAFPRTWSVTAGTDVLRVVQCWAEAARQVNNWYTLSVMLKWSVVH